MREVFPDLQTASVHACALSPVLQELSDPDGMGATPTHQADTQLLDHELWEAEGVLRIPPHVEGITTADAEEDQHTVEGGAVRMSRIQEKTPRRQPGKHCAAKHTSDARTLEPHHQCQGLVPR